MYPRDPGVARIRRQLSPSRFLHLRRRGIEALAASAFQGTEGRTPPSFLFSPLLSVAIYREAARATRATLAGLDSRRELTRARPEKAAKRGVRPGGLVIFGRKRERERRERRDRRECEIDAAEGDRSA